MIMRRGRQLPENQPVPNQPAFRSRWRLVGSAAALLATLGLLAGCGKTQPIRYYQLTIPGQNAPTLTPAIPVTIVVGRLFASQVYRDDHIVYSLDSQQMGTYEYQRWIEPPNVMIQQVFVRQLRSSGRYRGVYTPERKEAADYTVRGNLYDFKEVDSAGVIVARITMEVELRDVKASQVVWKDYYTHDEPVTAKTVPDIVAALDKNIQRAANDVATGLDQYFAAHPVN